MFTLFVLFVFAWLFVKSCRFWPFHVTWTGPGENFVATLLFVIAPAAGWVWFSAVVGALLPCLACPWALVAAAFCILKKA